MGGSGMPDISQMMAAMGGGGMPGMPPGGMPDMATMQRMMGQMGGGGGGGGGGMPDMVSLSFSSGFVFGLDLIESLLTPLFFFKPKNQMMQMMNQMGMGGGRR